MSRSGRLFSRFRAALAPTFIASLVGCSSGPYLYVANSSPEYMTPNVAGFTLEAGGRFTTGNAIPFRFINGPDTGLNRPIGVAVTSTAAEGYGAIVVLEPRAIHVYRAGENGNARPVNTIKGDAFCSFKCFVSAIALYPDDDSFFVADASEMVIKAFVRTATGNAVPARILRVPGSPIALAFDSSNTLYVAIGTEVWPALYQQANAVVAWAGGGVNGGPPDRVLKGPNTGIDGAIGLATDSAGNLYVLSCGFASAPGENWVTVYPPGANGNVSPIRTIRGNNTGLSERTFDFCNNYGRGGGITLDRDGNLYVSTSLSSSTSPFTFGEILVFAPGVNGNVAPIRTIQGDLTNLAGPSYTPTAGAVGP